MDHEHNLWLKQRTLIEEQELKNKLIQELEAHWLEKENLDK